MSDEAIAAAAPAAEAAPPVEQGLSGLQRLEAYYAAEANQAEVENSEPVVEVPANEEAPADETASPDDKPAETPETTEAEPPADEPEAETTDDGTPIEGEPDFKAVKEGESREYLTDIDAFKAKYPRNVATEVVEEFVEISKIAQKGEELERAIGGEHFREPVIKIATSLQNGDSAGIYTGIVEAANSETMLKVLGEAVYLSFVKGPEWIDNPETEEFGKSLSMIADAAVQERYGSDITADKLGKLVEWDRLGWFDKINEWTENQDIPYEEVNQLLQASNDPKYAELLRERTELKKQLEAKATQDESAAVEADSKIETSFGATVNDGIEKVLTDVIWKNSVLRDIPTDTPELKEAKAYFRESLTADAMKAFNSGDARGKLLSEFKQGRAATAQYKTAFTKAVADAVAATEKQTTIASKLLAKVYGTKRNSQIAPPKPPPTQPAGLTPSTPTDFAPTEAPSREGVKDRLNAFFNSQTAANG